jgi:hypothetical protein
MKLSTQPNRLVISSEIDSWNRIIGFPFFLIGILCIVGRLTGGMTDPSGQQAGWGQTLLIASLFGLPGLGMSFGRVKLMVDRSTRTAARRLQALIPVWKQSLDWSNLDKVSLDTVH